MRPISMFVAAVAIVALTPACSFSGSSDSEDATGTGETSTAEPGFAGPSCADIWVVGQTLPSDYTACADGADEGSQDATECLDGSQLIVFDDSVWAVTGDEVVQPDASPVQDTEAYGAAFTECAGE